MLDLKKQKAKKCVLKPSVFVYAKMNAAREMTLKNDAKRSFFRKGVVITRKILYNTAIFANFIENWSTIDNEF